MSSNLWRLADAVAKPWKNGGGVTRELYRESMEEGFALRISVAEVESDGPFSRFPNVDRVITVLSGRGMVLERDGVRVDVGLHAPYAFAGEDLWQCRLVNGPIQDLNIMVHRSRYRAAIVRSQTLATGQFLVALGAGTLEGLDVLPGDLVRLERPTPVTFLVADVHLIDVCQGSS